MLLGALALSLFVLACAGSGQMQAGTQARWACPSPTPRPWGEGAPPKEIIKHTRPISEGGDWEERIYWKEWEQEYPTPGLSVFPSPTPYGFTSDTFTFGQLVEIAPLHVSVDASAGPRATLNVPDADQLQIYNVRLSWNNPTGQAVAIDYSTQLTLRAITQADGRQRADGWQVTSAALDQARAGRLPREIPPGSSTVVVPVLAPVGQPQTVELTFLVGTSPGVATPTPATPTPNTDLRRPQSQLLTIQWTKSKLQYFDAPQCGSSGATTEWGSGPKQAPPVAPPPGANRLIEIALAQVGRPYIWGAKGPNAFDCSGLATWTYAQIGIRIPQGTAGQWPGMKAVSRSEVQPGDLVYFDMEGSGGIDHVGFVAGDLDGDGTWDLIHAANPQLGVRIDHNLFGSPYYSKRIRGFRTAR
jgi:cell wall-associated NlpC family hydrolase